jgi:hypothetical protein
MIYSLLTQMNTEGGAISSSVTATALGEAVLDGVTIPIGTNTPFLIAFPFATIQAYAILSTVNCTLYTNGASGAGGQTIALTANVPYTWINGGAGSNGFTINVTEFFVTSVAAGTLKARVLFNP